MHNSSIFPHFKGIKMPLSFGEMKKSGNGPLSLFWGWWSGNSTNE